MLLKKGARVTMLDVGLKLEKDREEIVRLVREKDRREWNEKFLERYKAGFLIRGTGVKHKPAYGSLFPYRDISPFRTVSKNVTAGLSYAQGGLSNVWGASVSTYLPEDLENWPITSAELAPYYREIFSVMPLSGAITVPGIAEGFRSTSVEELKMSAQLRGLHDRLQKLHAVHGVNDACFGGSRLAVKTCTKDQNGAGCVYCGLCMYGCPYSMIYNSTEMLEEFKRNEKFRYIPGVFVESLKESEGEVRIRVRDLATGSSQVLPAEKVYLGGGVFPTASILLRSYEAYDRPLFCLDSAYFLLPMISSWVTKGVAIEDLHTLAQLCLRIQKSPSKNAAFLQIYGYNDLYEKTLRFFAGFSYPIFRGFFNMFLERLFVVQGFLHSDDSSRIKITLRRNPAGASELFLEGMRDRSSSSALRGILGELSNIVRQVGVFPIFPMMDVGAPGRGYHSGGTFPMRERPGFGESDLLGRPNGFRNVHLVDASVFPAIPGGPITVNVMANAARIADQSG
jgi:choline dehydrogenase-like flavoprotein